MDKAMENNEVVILSNNMLLEIQNYNQAQQQSGFLYFHEKYVKFIDLHRVTASCLHNHHPFRTGGKSGKQREFKTLFLSIATRQAD
jgi:hypothetical protein